MTTRNRSETKAKKILSIFPIFPFQSHSQNIKNPKKLKNVDTKGRKLSSWIKVLNGKCVCKVFPKKLKSVSFVRCCYLWKMSTLSQISLEMNCLENGLGLEETGCRGIGLEGGKSLYTNEWNEKSKNFKTRWQSLSGRKEQKMDGKKQETKLFLFTKWSVDTLFI